MKKKQIIEQTYGMIPFVLGKKITNMQKKKIIYEQKFLEGYIRNLTLVIITSH